MSAKYKVQTFIDQYNKQVNQLSEKIEGCMELIEDLQIEVNYIQEKELPEAIEKRVLTGDSGLEVKLKKRLDKLQADLQQNQEELIVLQNVLTKYQYDSAKQLEELSKLFQEDRRIEEQKAYSKMMYAKREYVKMIQEESKVLHKNKAIDLQVQQILFKAGLRNGIHNIMTVDSASIPSYVDRHNGVYLALPHEEVSQLIKGTAKPSDLAYLDRFKHAKSL